MNTVKKEQRRTFAPARRTARLFVAAAWFVLTGLRSLGQGVASGEAPGPDVAPIHTATIQALGTLDASSLPQEPQPIPLLVPGVVPGGTGDPAVYPALMHSFTGLTDNYTAVPPDTQGAVGPEHLMVVLNTEVGIQRRDGPVISRVALPRFFAALQPTNVFDPRVIYDVHARRFVVAALSEPGTPASAVLIAISRTPDPTGTWDLAAIPSDSKGQLWSDFTSLGYNTNWIAVTANLYTVGTNSFVRSDILLFDKAGLATNRITAPRRFVETNLFTVVPAMTPDPRETNLLFATEFGTNALRLSRIQGRVGAESYFTNTAILNSPQPWLFSTATTNFPGGTNSAPQAGADLGIYVNDSRVMSVVNRDASIWVAQNVFLPTGTNAIRTAVQWWQARPDGTVLQRGRIDDPTGKTQFAFPSLAVNREQSMLIGYTRFSVDAYASAACSFRLAEDPAGTLRGPLIYRDGLAPYERIKPGGDEEGGRNSWGDFSATALDPLNDIDLWTIQEYAEIPGPKGDRWGTAWAWMGFGTNRTPLFTQLPTNTITLTNLGQPIRLELGVAGNPAPAIQWYRNQLPLPGATGAVYTLTPTSASDLGIYSVSVSNAFGYTRADLTRLAATAPRFVKLPDPITIKPGETGVLSVEVAGTGPFAYVWDLNGTVIPGANGPQLTLTHFIPALAGDYAVTVSNVAGVLTSPPLVVFDGTPLPAAAPSFASTGSRRDGSIELRMLIDPRHPIQLQISSNLVNWVEYFTFSSTNTVVLVQTPPLTNFPLLFFRAMVPR